MARLTDYVSRWALRHGRGRDVDVYLSDYPEPYLWLMGDDLALNDGCTLISGGPTNNELAGLMLDGPFVQGFGAIFVDLAVVIHETFSIWPAIRISDLPAELSSWDGSPATPGPTPGRLGDPDAETDWNGPWFNSYNLCHACPRSGPGAFEAWPLTAYGGNDAETRAQAGIYSLFAGSVPASGQFQLTLSGLRYLRWPHAVTGL